jgi:hypothetical protein
MRSRRLTIGCPRPGLVPGRLTPGLVSLLAPALALAGLGCREGAESPTAPEFTAQTPTVASTLVFRQVSPGAHHTCGVTEDDLAYCWGEAALGALGTGSPGVNQFRPVPVAGGHRFKNVSAGALYTCGITTDRLAYCWARTARASWATGRPRSDSRPFEWRVPGSSGCSAPATATPAG